MYTGTTFCVLLFLLKSHLYVCRLYNSECILGENIYLTEVLNRKGYSTLDKETTFNFSNITSESFTVIMPIFVH